MQTDVQRGYQKKYRDSEKYRETRLAWRKSPSGRNAEKRHRDTASQKPRTMFHAQKGRAKIRGIEFNLTFEQWWSIWSSSGRWEQRGLKSGQYVMSRRDDCGAYEVGNVEIIQNAENIAQMRLKSRFGRAAGILSFGL